MVILIVGGLFRSLEFTAINTVGYAEVDPARMSCATTLVSVNQQFAILAGVAVATACVETTMVWHGTSELTTRHFWPAFIVVGVIAAVSAWSFYKLSGDAGQEIYGHRVAEPAPVQPVETAAQETTEEHRDQRLGWTRKLRCVAASHGCVFNFEREQL
jgi:hypothetical protein